MKPGVNLIKLLQVYFTSVAIVFRLTQGLTPSFQLSGNLFSFVNVCRMVLRALLLKYIFFNKHC